MKTYSIVGTGNYAPTVLAATQPGTAVKLLREPSNGYDQLAIMVWIDSGAAGYIHVGYIPKKQNVALAQFIDQTAEKWSPPSGVVGAAIDAKFIRSPNSSYPQVLVDQ
jgi:hypothetical protein